MEINLPSLILPQKQACEIYGIYREQLKIAQLAFISGGGFESSHLNPGPKPITLERITYENYSQCLATKWKYVTDK